MLIASMLLLSFSLGIYAGRSLFMLGHAVGMLKGEVIEATIERRNKGGV